MADLDLGALMRQAQQLQEQMAHMKEQLGSRQVEGSAGAGMVKAVATGDMRIASITLDPSVMSEERAMVEDLVTAAVNNALDKARALAEQQLGGLVPPGMMPPGFPGT